MTKIVALVAVLALSSPVLAGKGGPPPASGPPAAVEVVVSRGAAQDTTILSVEDNGCGIARSIDGTHELHVVVCRSPARPGQADLKVTVVEGGQRLELSSQTVLGGSPTVAAESHLGKDPVKVSLRLR